YLGASPSKKSVQRLKTRIGDLLVPSNIDSWPEVCDKLNRSLRGWSNYFGFGALLSCSMCVAANWHGVLSYGTGPTRPLSGNHGNELVSDAERLPPRCRGRASAHSYCPSERLAMVPRASDNGRSASPGIGRAFRSGSLLHISGLSAW